MVTASVPKILLDDVVKQFAGNVVLDGVSLAVEPGESLAIIGQSGSGKSVTLKCILGLLKPDRGSIKVDGEEVIGLHGQALDRMRAKFGMLFQGSALFDSLPIWRNVTFGLTQGRRTDVTRMRALLATGGERALRDRAQHYAPFPLEADPALIDWRRMPADAALRFGARPSLDSARCSVGAQFVLGRLDATQLERLAALAEAEGDATLSMTPWQGVFVHGVRRERAPVVLDALASLRLV